MRRSFLYLSVILFLGCCARPQEARKQQNPEPGNTSTPSESRLLKEYDSYGFRIDTARVEDYRVRKNESLYLILDKYDFSDREIYKATQKAGEYVDVRSFRPGQRYRIYASRDDGSNLSRLVWHPNPVEFVVFEWDDSLRIYKSSRTVSTQLETASAEIENSLYETMTENRLSPHLAYRLSEIYAWQIDFFSLREGDRFRMLYERKYINDSYYDIGEIKAVEFTHRGEVYTALKYTNEDYNISGYFDEQGNSVQKALLKAPFAYSQRISSHFSRSRFHPILKRRIPHYGVDYAAPYGTPVLSVGDGTVTEARYRGASGNFVKIRHNGSYETAYLHLKGFARGIRRGARVKQGQVIGYVGKTGRVTRTHLDYRIYRDGRPVNPVTVDLPSSDSVPEEAMESFREVRNRYLERLERTTGSRPMLTRK